MPEQPGKNAIEVRGVRKVFGTGENQVAALDTVSVSIRENEFFTLLGPSGCGKTTLLRLIAGFDFPTAGEILLHGQDIAPLPPFKRPVNTVFQSYALFPHMTVAENIGFGLEMLGKPKAEIEARVAQMLKLVKMEALKARRTSQISGGQQQRVALARALAPQPKVLLLDEPLSALDYKLRKEMQIELKRLQHETGITFIFVTHDQEEALTMSDRIAVMSAGKILQVGTPRDIYDRPAERFVADFIGETNFLAGTVVSKKPGVATVKFASNATIAAGYPEGFDPTGEVTLVVRPEHADLVPDPAKGTIAGTLSNIVYFGTDTHYHVKLDGGGENFIVRHQNSRSSPVTYETGTKVGIQFEEDAARVLKD
ncbi:ABC transporter ATP-binding protein [Mesorhizobium sp.]|uniref:ABC transporter ATP-binding protein n=1 Tax=Mesorhizobium sp. TaxID=1871066 RepID=UPI000FE54EDC|nr:ABC transporter ATP-binding protein [Mesorhizobium sp.]RWM30783.1 MAG: ABC transporter ATP-binding protein [Mesorhizobium sp.]RWM41911.1 MAG: ABC transporter ATP-binding protein [Mesorhizobium sp.]TJV54020.1 MAG: ABC transporter ATP-binding protein [Mesorhizobium sp.]